MILFFSEVEDHKDIKIRCGEWDTQQNIEPLNHVDRIAKHISIHPAFDRRNLINDVALIHLEEDFPLTQHINIICLPDPLTAEDFDLKQNDVFETSNCIATGWGQDKFGSDSEYQVTLKQVAMDLVDKTACQDRFRKTRLGKNFLLDDSYLCAGGLRGHGTCKGDGGGPLVCPSKFFVGQYEQIGIVSWGLGCGYEVPETYADVTKALRFIDWATKCVDGENADHYNFGFANRWAKHKYCEYKYNINLKKNRIKKLRENRNPDNRKVINRSIASYKKYIRLNEKFIPQYKKAILSCAKGKKDLNCEVYDYSLYR